MKVWTIVAAALLLAQQVSADDRIPRREKSKLSRRAREETSPVQRILTGKSESKSKGRVGRPGAKTCRHGKPECWIDEPPTPPTPGPGCSKSKSRALFSAPASAPAELNLLEGRELSSRPRGKDEDDFTCCQSYDIDQCDFDKSGGPIYDCIGYLHDGMAIIFPKDANSIEGKLFCCKNDCSEVEHCTEIPTFGYPCNEAEVEDFNNLPDFPASCNFATSYLVLTSFDNGGEGEGCGNCRIQSYCCPRKDEATLDEISCPTPEPTSAP